MLKRVRGQREEDTDQQMRGKKEGTSCFDDDNTRSVEDK